MKNEKFIFLKFTTAFEGIKMNRNIGVVKSIWSGVSKRLVHYKVTPKNYPKVNIKDVELEKPRYGFREERPALLSQEITDTLYPSADIKQAYLEAGKPVPIRYRNNSDLIAKRHYENYKEAIATGEAHFRIGENEVYLPKARVVLLKPSAKHTPYQARFLVPRNFNKMDLRDYLWNLYGLRALNVTSQLSPVKLSRTGADYSTYRRPQVKTMTIEMDEPFVWPEHSKEKIDQYNKQAKSQKDAIRKKALGGMQELNESKAFDGLYKRPELVNTFVPKRLKKQGSSIVQDYKKHSESKQDKELLSNYLGL